MISGLSHEGKCIQRDVGNQKNPENMNLLDQYVIISVKNVMVFPNQWGFLEQSDFDFSLAV